MFKINENKIKYARKLRKDGLSYKQIARKLNINISNVKRYVNSVKLTSEGKKIIEGRIKRNKERFVRNFGKVKKIKKTGLTKNKIRIIAHCLFDGSVFVSSNNAFGIAYTNSSEDAIKQFQMDIKDVFGFNEAKIYKRTGKTGYWYQTTYYSKMAFQDLLRYLPTYSTKKKECRIKEWVFNLPADLKIEFLRAFWDDEGCISKDGKIYGKSKSQKIIEQLMLLHNSLDINCSLWKDNISKNFSIYIFKDLDNIARFSAVGFKNGLVSRGDFKGMKKATVLQKIHGFNGPDGI